MFAHGFSFLTRNLNFVSDQTNYVLCSTHYESSWRYNVLFVFIHHFLDGMFDFHLWFQLLGDFLRKFLGAYSH